jgi:lipopolysaccharide export LptBFGC system permease protein LptF
MSLASRLLLSRGLHWLAVALAATSLLVVLVDWVEHSSRVEAQGGAALAASLQLALLLLPAHLSRAMPVVVALGVALAVVGLRRSGEWQALSASGLGPTRLLLPYLALGALGGAASAGLDAWVVPSAARAHSRALAVHHDRPLRSQGVTWIAHNGIAFRLEGEVSSGRLSHAAAFALGDDLDVWTSAGLAWRDPAWVPPDNAVQPPWSQLPGPEILAELIGPEQPSALSWSALREDDRPSSGAEVQGRLSRPLAAPLAALVAAALCALIAPGSAAVLLAAAPVLAWELMATALHSQASLGQLPATTIPAARLGLGLLVLAALMWRARRP